MKYRDEEEILLMIAKFESGTIPRSDWRHAEHLIVACRYLFEHDFEEAAFRMRSGILSLLTAFGVDQTAESPYHETLTVFWMRAVDAFRLEHPELWFFELCERITSEFDKDFPLRFYSRERLFSADAKRTFLEPDLVALNKARRLD
ncbi:MAG: hypothetical protein IPJ30_03650 [Acidobacteria bacterium]|nr:hypothetical protein [Acidobacteriota bacterium]